MAKKISRRSFLEVALAGGTLGTANLTLMRDAYAQASGPIVIGHHCDLTGAISSWGVWHDKAAKAAVDIINAGGGIAGRKVELATEDTESNPASGARKLRNLVQRLNAEFIVGSVHSGVMLAAIPVAYTYADNKSARRDMIVFTIAVVVVVAAGVRAFMTGGALH